MSSSRLKVQHTSLQFSDSREQQKHDVRQLFVSGKNYPIKTVTEASKTTHSFEFLQYMGKEFNHAIHIVRGNGIAIDRRIIKKGTLVRDSVFVAGVDQLVGPMQDRVMATVSFEHQDPRIGVINQGAAHYPARGRTPNDPNHNINRLYAKKIAEWMKDVAKGPDLAFVNGDFNMVDSDPKQDWAFGRNWTSMADELEAWKDTGHGPIDGFASYDLDGRVSASKFDVFRDNRIKMFSDHFVVRGEWSIKHLKLG